MKNKQRFSWHSAPLNDLLSEAMQHDPGTLVRELAEAVLEKYRHLRELLETGKRGY